MTKTAFVLCLLTALSASAQTAPSITMGTAKVQVGMSRADVSDAIRPAGLTARSDDPNWWFLYDVQNQQIGALRFRNDRVVGALQNWVQLDPSGVRTANGFIGAVAEVLGKAGSAPCTVTVESQATPTMNGRSVKLRCGKKSVVIGSSRFHNGNEATIVIEALGDVWLQTPEER